MSNKVPGIFKGIGLDLLNLFYPATCCGCGEALIKGESQLCLSCIATLPRTHFHDMEENTIETRFFGKVKMVYATSFLHFEKKTITQRLLHEIKYDRKKELGKMLGCFFGDELRQSRFNNIDIIIPVPLHPNKLKSRGYNQSEWIAMGISETMGKPLITDALIRQVETNTQTKKNAFERWENVDGIFHVALPDKVRGKHALIIDDVVTTGSTLEACATELLKIDGTTVSAAALAAAE
ncbi:MAG: ComF family protein [Paludibacteraceae bacterium]|nr:ComF family protein [Paludibacteraceae bacterium]